MTIEEWQQITDNWIKTVGVRYFEPMTNTVLLMEEVGEFSRLMARKYGEQSFKKPSDVENVDDNIEEEVADIFFVLTCLANQMDINLTEALNRGMDKRNNRDKTRHKENRKLNN